MNSCDLILRFCFIFFHYDAFLILKTCLFGQILIEKKTPSVLEGKDKCKLTYNRQSLLNTFTFKTVTCLYLVFLSEKSQSLVFGLFISEIWSFPWRNIIIEMWSQSTLRNAWFQIWAKIIYNDHKMWNKSLKQISYHFIRVIEKEDSLLKTINECF